MLRGFLVVGVVALSLVASAEGVPRHLVFAGDSILQRRGDADPCGSWGDALAPSLKPGIEIVNLGIGGRSTKSYIREGHWKRVLSALSSNDVVFISFGHNDQIKSEKLYTAPEGEYCDNLIRFAKDVRLRGAVPLFVTPLTRRWFGRDGHLACEAQLPYAAAMRKVANELGVELADMNAATRELIERTGQAGVLAWYAPNDGEHPSKEGARRFAALFLDLVRRQGLSVERLFVSGGWRTEEDVAFTADYDGTEQRYVLMVPEGLPERPDLIIGLHGHGSDRWQVVKQSRGECKSIRDVVLARKAVLVSPDYRAKTSWMGPAAEADVLQIIGDMRKRFNVNRVFMIGGSMGGTSALTFAKLHPDMIAGLTAFNPLADHLSYGKFQDAIEASFGAKKAENPEPFRVRSAISAPWIYLPMAVSITVGGQDMTIPPESARALAKRIAEYHPGTVFMDDDPNRGHETNYEDSMRAIGRMFACADKLTDGTLWRGKPKTQKRYLHGPLAERMLVMTRCGSVTLGEVCHRRKWAEMLYSAQEAHGIQLVAADGEVFDYGSMDLRVGNRGIPVHGQTWHAGDIDLDLEGCAPFGRRPSANLRFRVTNRGTGKARATAAFLVRTGREKRLVFDAPDGYQFYIPNARNWHETLPVWSASEDGVLRDGERFVSYAGDLPCEWDRKAGELRFSLELAPGETRTLDLVVGKGETEMPAYEAAKARTVADWEKELARAAKRPVFIQNLLVQMLQCFSRPTVGDFVLPRQGGLQRWVWPGDQKAVSAALTLLGYREYVEHACDFYFGEYAQPNGEIGPFANNWASDTADVLLIFSRYCRETGNAAFWRKHREAAARAFRWMKAKRAETSGRTDCVPGLYPPMKSSDMPQVFQFWGGTDITNLDALEAYAAAAERFGDPEAAAAKAEASDYRAVLSGIVKRWRRASEGKDTLWFPLAPDGKDEKILREAGFFYCHPARIVSGGFLSADDMLRLRKWLLDEKFADANGLYQRQSTNWKDGHETHVWYTTWSELQWCEAWMKVGRRDLAEQAYRACCDFSVTEENYVGERCFDKTPWFFPWTPNASGAGRLVQMHELLDTKSSKAAALDPVEEKRR